jgi:hypothetical protein
MDSKEAELTSKILDRKVRLLTISEVAGLTKFSYRTIWNYVKTGYLKSVIISDKHIRIPSTEYQKLISNRKWKRMDNRLYVDKETRLMVKIICGVQDKKQSLVLRSAVIYWAKHHGFGDILEKFKQTGSEDHKN